MVDRSANEDDIREDADLTELVHEKQRTLGSLLGFVELINWFCGVCLTSAMHQSHKVSEGPGGTVYKQFNCGKRGVKTTNLG